MSGRQVVAWVLIGAGAIALLARVGPGTGWLWVALASAGFLAAYRQQGTYAFLVVGSILGGIAAGILLEGAWGWPGAFLMCLGLGFLVIDRVEPKESRWPIYPAAVLIGLGLVYWLFRAGIVQSLWFPFLLIIAGIYLLRRPRGSEWVEVGDGPQEEATGTPSEAVSERSEPPPGAPAGRGAPSPDEPRAEDTATFDADTNTVDDGAEREGVDSTNEKPS
ncbi:MAG TPA: hypothetical protein VF168_07480 [Trueperaceae bacterium]